MSGAEAVGLVIALAVFAYLMVALLRPERFEMTAAGWIEIALYIAILTAITPLLGALHDAGVPGEIRIGLVERSIVALGGDRAGLEGATRGRCSSRAPSSSACCT